MLWPRDGGREPSRSSAIATQSAPPRITADQHVVAAASLRARIGGYVVDMVILSAIAMVVLTVGGILLLFSIDFGEQDPSNADMYLFTAIIGIGCVVVWTVLNLSLLATRNQTGGQYVAGIRLARSDGAAVSARDAMVWWLCLNPLLFSWPIAGVAGYALLLPAALLASNAMLIAGTFVIILSVVSPLAALASALLDRNNRGLHDRIVGTRVVPVG